MIIICISFVAAGALGALFGYYELSRDKKNFLKQKEKPTNLLPAVKQ